MADYLQPNHLDAAQEKKEDDWQDDCHFYGVSTSS
jgi:hypothetical protein